MALSNLENTALQDFVSSYFQQDVKFTESIQGDAGMRCYYRVGHSDKTYVVMDCPVNYCSVSPFIKIADYLQNNGFSAPKVIAQDISQGFLILEDFGTTSVKDCLLGDSSNSYSKRNEIYKLIIDLLLSLQKQNIPPRLDLKQFGNELLCSELSVFIDYYIPHTYQRKLSDDEYKEFADIWRSVLSMQIPMNDTMVLRDYHVENMMYLQSRGSINKIGLLDFQDALLGSPIYDLVSVLEDARISVPREEAMHYVKYFANSKGLDVESVLLNYHILGAQRNARILGIFSRKVVRDDDTTYLKYMDRVKKYLDYDLSHPKLTQLKEWFMKLGNLNLLK